MLWFSTFHSPMTLTLDFQGKILKKSYLRNGMADWHGVKGMWVDRMLDSHCDFKLWPHPLPWPWIFKVKYWNCCNTGITGGNRAKLPSSRWRRRGRSLREVFACPRLFATTDLSQICNRVTRGHGTPCTKTTNSYPFSFLYNNLRKIRHETTVDEKSGRR